MVRSNGFGTVPLWWSKAVLGAVPTSGCAPGSCSNAKRACYCKARPERTSAARLAPKKAPQGRAPQRARPRFSPCTAGDLKPLGHWVRRPLRQSGPRSAWARLSRPPGQLVLVVSGVPTVSALVMSAVPMALMIGGLSMLAIFLPAPSGMHRTPARAHDISMEATPRPAKTSGARPAAEAAAQAHRV